MNDWKELVSTELMSTGTEAQQVYFMRRTAQMSPKEWRIMQAAVQLGPPESLADAVDLTFSLYRYSFNYPAHDYNTLGRHIARYEHGVRDESLLQAIDCDRLGLEYTEKNPGLFIAGAYVQSAGHTQVPSMCEKTGDGPLVDTYYSAKIKISGPNGNEVWLRLPSYEEVDDGRPDEVTVALADIGADSLAECIPLEAHCIFPEAGDLLRQYSDLEKLVWDANNLGFALEDQNQGQRNFLPTLRAALKHEPCESLRQVLDTIENLHCYDYVPDEKEVLLQLGREIAAEKGITRKLGLIDFIDYEMLAHSHLCDKGMCRIEGGYFMRNGNHFEPFHTLNHEREEPTEADETDQQPGMSMWDG